MNQLKAERQKVRHLEKILYKAKTGVVFYQNEKLNPDSKANTQIKGINSYAATCLNVLSQDENKEDSLQKLESIELVKVNIHEIQTDGEATRSFSLDRRALREEVSESKASICNASHSKINQSGTTERQIRKKNDSMIVKSSEIQLEDLNDETCKKSQ